MKKDKALILAILLLALLMILLFMISWQAINKQAKETIATLDASQYEEKEEEIVIETQEKTEPSFRVEANYYIKVNVLKNVVTVYEEKEGEYVPVKAMVCSCGKDTPKEGTYAIGEKYLWRDLFDQVYGQYASRITGYILFHSVPYLDKENKGSLEYWEYDKLGEEASAGCVRLTVEDAKWIYDYAKEGTKVEFYQDENPGPLGKPEAKKISDDLEKRNWDPTDPDENNPWKEKKTS